MNKRWDIVSFIHIGIWITFGFALVLMHIFAGGSALLLLGFMFGSVMLGEINYLSHCIGVLIKALSKHVDDKSLNFLAKQTCSETDSPPYKGDEGRKEL